MSQTTSNSNTTDASLTTKPTVMQSGMPDDNVIVVSLPGNFNQQISNRIEPASTRPLWLDVAFSSLLTLYSTALVTQLIAAIPFTTPLTSQLIPISGVLILAVFTASFILRQKRGLVNLPIRLLLIPLAFALGVLTGL